MSNWFLFYTFRFSIITAKIESNYRNMHSIDTS